MDSTVMKTLTGGYSCRLVNETELLRKNPSSYTALITGIISVYSLFPGKLIFVGSDNDLATLDVEVAPNEVIRYLGFTSFDGWYGRSYEKGDYIGEVSFAKGLRIEYCTMTQDGSPFPVRIQDWMWYKQNPMKILNGSWTPATEKDPMGFVYRAYNNVPIEGDLKYAFGTLERIVPDTSVSQITGMKNIPDAALDELSYNGGN